MPGPIDALRFVHSAILAEAAALEQAAHDAGSPGDAAPLRERVALFSELVDAHTRGEEAGLFPVLAERAPKIADTYLFDHTEERALFAAMLDSLDRCAQGDAQALATLRRQTIALSEHSGSHVRKENELVLPYVAEHFPPPEQGEIVQKILSVFTPEQMAAAVPWIVRNVSLDEAVAYTGAISKAMPPPVFAKAKGWIEAGVPAERWQALVERVEGLSG